MCPSEVVQQARVNGKIELPKGWTQDSVSSEYLKYFAKRPGPLQFCSSEHGHAFMEAVRASVGEAMDVAKSEFTKRLASKKRAALSAVDALATLAPEDAGDRSK
jgi:hypothetical protein